MLPSGMCTHQRQHATGEGETNVFGVSPTWPSLADPYVLMYQAFNTESHTFGKPQATLPMTEKVRLVHAPLIRRTMLPWVADMAVTVEGPRLFKTFMALDNDRKDIGDAIPPKLARTSAGPREIKLYVNPSPVESEFELTVMVNDMVIPKDTHAKNRKNQLPSPQFGYVQDKVHDNDLVIDLLSMQPKKQKSTNRRTVCLAYTKTHHESHVDVLFGASIFVRTGTDDLISKRHRALLRLIAQGRLHKYPINVAIHFSPEHATIAKRQSCIIQVLREIVRLTGCRSNGKLLTAPTAEQEQE